MGQVIAFPAVPAAYPDLTADLDTAEHLLIGAIRWWVESHRTGEDPIPRLLQSLETAGTPDAAFSIDGFMTVVARAVTRPVEINCPECPHLSLDEKHLLRAASLAQAEERDLSRRVLRTTVLSAQGARDAIVSLECPGQSAGRATARGRPGLFFCTE